MISKISKSILRPAVILAGLFIFGVQTQAQTVKQLTSSKSAKKNSEAAAAAALLSGQELHIHSIGIGIGQTLLMSDLQDNGEDKITAELFYNYKASYSFDFYANLHYSKHEFENSYSKIAGLLFGAKGKLFHYDAFQPFFAVGLGFFRPQIKTETYKSDAKTVFGYQLGAGADFDLNRKISVGAMASFNDPFDVDQENRSDVEGYYFKVLLTVFYKF
ncbi:outer membrane protein [Halobacteriovorax sp. GFR7]|uniref:outer membrane protein n=1 Tax=unclassified Halobacteriovorax TaxID=2639665 RepID=UPI00371DFF53